MTRGRVYLKHMKGEWIESTQADRQNKYMRKVGKISHCGNSE